MSDTPRPGGDELRTTVEVLHGVVEHVLAGPQHRASGTIRLRVTPGAIGTVRDPAVRLLGDRVVGPAGEAPLDGSLSLADVGRRVGVEPGVPDGVYTDHAAVGSDDPARVDAGISVAVLEWFAVGAAALVTFAPESEAVLWPEHFDLAVTVDGVNYGVSPGDGFSAAPYAYVGPHSPVDDTFFDAPFGAARTWDQVPDVAGVAAFFADGRGRVHPTG
ncbi:hypothetical protein [Aquipuribacter sp. SD81]|uniref:hypothetical protein n=1 Tax=Aquipuribacter sp. SD81 TaxID=3127703 RepID=UPI0030179CA7